MHVTTLNSRIDFPSADRVECIQYESDPRRMDLTLAAPNLEKCEDATSLGHKDDDYYSQNTEKVGSHQWAASRLRRG